MQDVIKLYRQFLFDDVNLFAVVKTLFLKCDIISISSPCGALVEQWLRSFARVSQVAGSILSSCDVNSGCIFGKILFPHALTLA